MNYDGKTYRNLEGQVKYLTEVAEALDERITEVAANIPSKMIVEELPEEGDPLITYYVGPKGTAPNYYYEVWVWVQEVEDGPFVWRELEDTDQVDLSGYLPIQTGATTEKQVYTKNADGTQTMIDVAQSVVAGAIPLRGSSGQILVPTGTPSSDSAATSKGYVVSNFVAKNTTTTTYDQLYVKKADGSQSLVNFSGAREVGSIPMYVSGGNLNTGDPTNDYQAVNRGYANDHYVIQDTGTSSYYHIYCKNPDGTQGLINGHTSPLANAVPIYRTGGTLRVATPTNDADAATKKYVDDAVGQVIYKHSITLTFTVSSRLFQLDISLMNGTSTAYTSTDGRQIFAFLKGGAYSISTESYTESRFWSVAICPSDKYIHDDTGIGFILTAGSDGTTIYVDGIDPNYNSDITGVTISDVVTTW